MGLKSFAKRLIRSPENIIKSVKDDPLGSIASFHTGGLYTVGDKAGEKLKEALKLEIPGATDPEKEGTRVSVDMWNNFVSNYMPLEHEYIQELKTIGDERRNVKGRAMADVEQSFAGSASATARAMRQTGAAFGSGRSKATGLGDAIRKGTAKAKVGRAADEQIDVQELQGRMKIAAMGRNVADSTTIGFGEAASRSSSLAMAEAQATHQRNQALVSGAGALLGGAARKFGPGLIDAWAENRKFASVTGSVDNIAGGSGGIVDLPDPSARVS